MVESGLIAWYPAVMNLRASFLLGFLSFIFGLGGEGFASELTLKVKVFYPQPTPEQMEAWTEQVFELEDEVWIFQSRADYLQILDRYQLGDELRQLLEGLYRHRAGQFVYSKANFIFELDGVGVVLVPSRTRKLLPKGLIEDVYAQVYQKVGRSVEIARHLPYPDRWLKYHEIDGERRIRIRRHLFFLEGQNQLIPSPGIWGELPVEFREEVVTYLVGPNRLRKGLSVSVVVESSDDLESVARELSMDDEGFERVKGLIEKKLESDSEVEVPIEDLLPVHVGQMVNRYPDVAGQNCFSTSACFDSDSCNAFEENERVWAWLDKIPVDFVRLQEGELPRFGDLVLSLPKGARPDSQRFLHAARYIAQDVALTKNGTARFNPYLFQSLEMLRDIYGLNQVFYRKRSLRSR